MISKEKLLPQRGFTLIEMAIVLAVFGLLVGGGLVAMTPLLERTRLKQTAANLDQIEQALQLFFIRNNHLPCPANGGLASSAAGYGRENGSAIPPSSGCTIAPANGIVPWNTLGLPEDVSYDGWSRRISYVVADDYNSTFTSGAVSAADDSAHVLRTGNMYPASTYLDVENSAGNDVTDAGDRPAYVLISHGENGFGAYGPGANTRLPTSGATTEELENTDGDAKFVEDAGDDVVRWRQIAFLIQNCGAGACGNP